MTIIEVQKGQASLPTPNPTSSFWLSSPAPLLRNHRTTAKLPSSSDVIIIGSGIAGSFAAHYLSTESSGKDLKVLMLEAREACSGATGRNGGHCQPKVYGKPAHLARFELANLKNLRDFVTKEKIDCEWQDVQGCHAYMTGSMFKQAVSDVMKIWREDEEIGQDVTIVTGKVGLREMRLDERVVGAVMQKKAASLWPYKLVAGILERLLLRRSTSVSGEKLFNLQTNTSVTNVQRLTDGSWAVHTSRGIIAAKQVLLATNAYTSHLLPSFTDLIVPVRGDMIALAPPRSLQGRNGELAGHYSYAFIGNGTDSSDKDEYLIQRPIHEESGMNHSIGGHLMLGGGRRLAAQAGVGISDDSEIDHRTISYLQSALNDVLDIPSQSRDKVLRSSSQDSWGKDQKKDPFTITHEWSGIMGFSKDSAPWVDAVPEGMGGGNGLFICAGFTSHGMPNASLSAKAIVKQMLGSDISDTDLPPEFKISVQRIQAAETLADVKTQEERRCCSDGERIC